MPLPRTDGKTYGNACYAGYISLFQTTATVVIQWPVLRALHVTQLFACHESTVEAAVVTQLPTVYTTEDNTYTIAVCFAACQCNGHSKCIKENSCGECQHDTTGEKKISDKLSKFACLV